MEIRQVLKSSASMIPDLFYKVSDETREMENNRDSGGKGWKERRMSQKEELRRKIHNSPRGEDVARRGKNPQIWRGGVSGEGKKRGRIEEEQKEKPVKLLAAGVRLRLSTCASLAISKPRLIRQALNSSAPRVPEWSWGGGRPVPGEAPGRGAAPQAMQQHIQRCQ